jgi:NADH-quinone oxidoreductase subunit L
MNVLYLVIPLAPLAGSLVAGLFGRAIGRAGAHWVTILGVTISFVCSVVIFQDVQAGHTFRGAVYTWMETGGLTLQVGFLIDQLTAVMMVVVTFVSLMVHIYTIGYMADDPGYQRFFSYISLFTFSMLMLVMADNFLQLFFGWEAVGLVSYLLIGFWYTRPTAIYANLKAFLVNRRLRLPDRHRPYRRLRRHPRLRRRLRQGHGTGDHDRDGHRLAPDHRHLHWPLRRRHGQVGPVPAARLAA